MAQGKAGTSAQSEKGSKGVGLMRTTRGLQSSAPPHTPRPAVLTSSGSRSEQADHGISSSGSRPATLLPKSHLSQALNGLGGKSYRGHVNIKGETW